LPCYGKYVYPISTLQEMDGLFRRELDLLN